MNDENTGVSIPFNKKIESVNKSPLDELSEKDRGDETQRRYRHQHTVTAYYAF